MEALFRREVLDKGYLEVQRVDGSDQEIVAAARVSFLGDSKGEEKDRRLLHYLYRHRHMTPFEQVGMKVRVKAPVVVWWQWVRHRTQSYNFQSGRYTPFEEDEYYIPETWRKQSESNKQGSAGPVGDELNDLLNRRLQELAKDSHKLYQFALDHGVAKEQARLLLPAFGLYYEAVSTANLRNWLHFLSLRNAPDAQWEIRQYAKAVEEAVAEFFPWTYSIYKEVQGKV